MRRAGWVVALLVAVFVGQVALSIPHQSQTFDESVHLFSGYQYWRHADFGANPEHPPLLKLIAAAPLLTETLAPTTPAVGPTKAANGAAGITFLYKNTVPASRLLFNARMAATVFGGLLIVLVFLAGRELFDPETGLVAAAWLAVEPNLLANAPLITTDTALTTCLFATVFAWYRYVTRPTAVRLAVSALAVTLTLASKHSAVLLGAILPLLLVGDALLCAPGPDARRRALVRALAGLAVAFAIAWAGLWVFYGFRYAARPDGFALSPSLAGYIGSLASPLQRTAIQAVTRWHLLPESYLWGLTDVFVATEGRPTFILGKVYARGQWFYFPLVFAMKMTLPMLAMLAAAPFVIRPAPRSGSDDGAASTARAVWFLLLPAVAWMAISMGSGLNLGFRHILPMLPLLTVLAAAAATRLARQRRGFAWAVAALLGLHAVSSLRAFPDYLTYSNEAVGGPASTYRVMSDANADWGQGLVQASRYLAKQGIRDCWFVNRMPHVDPADLGIPCTPLQAGIRNRLLAPPPPVVEGTVLVSANEINGQGWGPGALNPYGFLADVPPTAVIGNSILVFTGRFDFSLAAAANRARRAQQLLNDKRLDEAEAQAREAVALAAGYAEAQAMLCLVLRAQGRDAEARPVCDETLRIADRVEPEFQYLRVPPVRVVAAALRPGARPPGR